MLPNPPKAIYTIRLQPDLADYAASYGNRTYLIETLLEAHREGRLCLVSNPNKFEKECLAASQEQRLYISSEPIAFAVEDMPHAVSMNPK